MGRHPQSVLNEQKMAINRRSSDWRSVRAVGGQGPAQRAVLQGLSAVQTNPISLYKRRPALSCGRGARSVGREGRVCAVQAVYTGGALALRAHCAKCAPTVSEGGRVSRM